MTDPAGLSCPDTPEVALLCTQLNTAEVERDKLRAELETRQAEAVSALLAQGEAARAIEAERDALLAGFMAWPHEDWCCAKGCACPEGECGGGEANCRCIVSQVRATLAAAGVQGAAAMNDDDQDELAAVAAAILAVTLRDAGIPSPADADEHWHSQAREQASAALVVLFGPDAAADSVSVALPEPKEQP